jgi:hypothetical protein
VTTTVVALFVLPAAVVRFAGEAPPPVSPEDDLLHRWAGVEPGTPVASGPPPDVPVDARASARSSPSAPSRRSDAMNRLLTTGLVLALAGLPLSACKEVETETATGYTPSKVEELKEGSKAFPRVTFTAEGAKRTGVESARVRRAGGRRSSPTSRSSTDSEGKTYIYHEPEAASTTSRAEVKVDRIEGARVFSPADRRQGRRWSRPGPLRSTAPNST